MLNKKDVAPPSLLNKLVSLTTIRDIELFEFSLLKTLAELLSINQISMYKLDQTNTTCWLSTYSIDFIQDDSKRQFSESQEICTSEITIPEEIKSAQLWMETTRKPYIHYRGDRCLVVYPILTVNKIEEMLTFELPHPLTEGEMLIISSLLSITHNFRSLLDESQKDKLTGLLNRQTFEENIKKISALTAGPDIGQDHDGNMLNRRRPKVETEKFCLAIIDIDDFKSINDRFGHIMGDEVLLLLSYVMKQNFRARDLLFRFGGEEFVVIFRAPDKEEAYKALERFRNKIQEYHFPQIETVTISMGATLINELNYLASEIIGRADQALYHAKQSGKNQLHFYENLLENGHVFEKREASAIDVL
ncbi:diguanylate cyclase (GGDEF) domain-containing protein [Nitrosomonas ureae]|uniref:diguanylate cyclase n=2 Tax=Nitrosomonas ureae TaxID=44577 RepID=A0A1H5WI27_9PROT|nr:diguanylate cyclase (GGDEF) domain-containing protein [Nitrosomonas ureae]